MPDFKFKFKIARKFMSQIDTSKATGLDGISVIVLKKYALELAPVLTRLSQISYDSDIFPTSWKTAAV